jgi:hypothetical protein
VAFQEVVDQRRERLGPVGVRLMRGVVEEDRLQFGRISL